MDLTQNFALPVPGIMVPAYALTIEGAPLPAPLLRAILSVGVTQVANKPASFSLQINDPTLTLVDAVDGLFAEGRKVGIAMGYVGKLQPVIAGEITSISVELGESGGLTLGVEGFDGLHAGSRGTRYREFREGLTDSAIVQQIAGDLQLGATVDPTGPRSDRRVQSNVSDLDYLQELTAANDYQLWVENGILFFKRVRSAPQVTVARGRDLISFSARLNTAGHVSAVEVRGWDAGQKQAFSARASISQAQDYVSRLSLTGQAQIAGAANSARVIYADGAVRTIDEAQRLADASLAEQRRNQLSAEGSAVGNPDIRVGSTLLLANLGRFSSRYIVERAQHTIDQGGYRTSFEMRQQP